MHIYIHTYITTLYEELAGLAGDKAGSKGFKLPSHSLTLPYNIA